MIDSRTLTKAAKKYVKDVGGRFLDVNLVSPVTVKVLMYREGQVETVSIDIPVEDGWVGVSDK